MLRILTFFNNNFDIIKTLLFFMILDYITAILVAAYQKKLNSIIGYRGIIKKIGIIISIVLVYQIDTLNLLKDDIKVTPLVLSFFIFNEIISCFENLKKLEIPISQIINSIMEKIKTKNN